MFAGHTSYVYTVALTEDSDVFVTASADHTVRTWSINSRSCLRIFDFPFVMQSVCIRNMQWFFGLTSVL